MIRGQTFSEITSRVSLHKDLKMVNGHINVVLFYLYWALKALYIKEPFTHSHTGGSVLPKDRATEDWDPWCLSWQFESVHFHIICRADCFNLNVLSYSTSFSYSNHQSQQITRRQLECAIMASAKCCKKRRPMSLEQVYPLTLGMNKHSLISPLG